MKSALDMLQDRLNGNLWLAQNAPFPTQARPQAPTPGWTDKFPPLSRIAYEPESYGWGSPYGQKMPPVQDIRDIEAFLGQYMPTSQTPTLEMFGGSPLNQLMRRQPPVY